MRHREGLSCLSKYKEDNWCTVDSQSSFLAYSVVFRVGIALLFRLHSRLYHGGTQRRTAGHRQRHRRLTTAQAAVRATAPLI